MIHAKVEVGSQLYTDDHVAYTDLNGLFFRHAAVNHSTGEYVRGPVSTNSIESRMIGDVPGIQTERELIDVAGEMFGAHLMVDAMDAALQDGPHGWSDSTASFLPSSASGSPTRS